MSRFDDDIEDDDLEEIDDDDEGLSGSTSRSNPFSSGASVRGAGLPSARPTPPEGGTGSSNTPSPFNRPGETRPDSRSSEGNTPQPFNRQPLGGGSTAKPPTPFGGAPGAPPRSDNTFKPPAARPAFNLDDDDDKPAAPKPSAPVQRPSPFASGDKRDDAAIQRPSPFASERGGDAPARPAQSGGNRGDDKKDDPPARPSVFGSPNRPDDKRDAVPARPTTPFGGGKPDDRKDDRSSDRGAPPRSDANKPAEKSGGIGGALGGALGGLRDRLPGSGGKSDDKPAPKKDDKPAEKSGGVGGAIGGALGGLRDRLPGGGKSDDKPAPGKNDKPDEKSGGVGAALGGAFGSLRDRLPGAKPEEKKPDQRPASGSGGASTSTAPRPGGGFAGTPGPVIGGGASSSPARPGSAPATSGASALSTPVRKDDKPVAGAAASGGFGSRLPGLPGLGGAKDKDAKPAPKAGDKKPAAKAGAPVSLVDRMRALNPFATTAKDKSKPKTAKGVKVDQDGLTLDNKLDILGIGLVIGALVMLLSSLSPTKGAITETISGALSYAFGALGAVVVAVIVLVVGIWLLARHFGDDAPTVSRTRIVGFALLFAGALTMVTFIDSFALLAEIEGEYLTTVRIILPIAYTLGRGGGYIGGEIYYLLLSNFGEIGAFFVPLLGIIIGVMLSLDLTVADFAVIVLSNVRNLRDANTRRSQRVASHRMERQEVLAKAAAAAAAAAALNPPKPRQDPLLPAPAPALPMPQPALASGGTLPLEEGREGRSISISTGGRTSTMNFPTSADTLPLPMQPAAFAPLSPAPQTIPAVQPPAPAPTRGGIFGGLPKIGGLGGRGDKDKQPAPTPAKPAVAPAAGAVITGAAAALSTASSAQPPAASPFAGQPIPAAPRSPDPVTQPYERPAAQATTPFTPPAPGVNFDGTGAPSPFSAPTPQVQPTISASPTAVSPVPASALPTSTPAAAPVDPFGGAADLTPSRPQPYQRPPLGSGGTGARTESASPVDRDALPAFKGTSDLYAPGNLARPAGADAPAASLTPPVGATPARPPMMSPGTTVPAAPPSIRGSLGAELNAISPPARRTPKEWKMPDTATLLASGDDQEVDHELLLRRARIIEETLSSFGAPGRVVDVRTGPVVTQFGVEPDYIEVRGGKKNRVKVGAIAALDKDMQLALGARSIRIEAPVPGKGYVGIEVPNEKAEIVRLRDVLESDNFRKARSKSPLGIALGQSVDGTPIAADLAAMPHLLIAGTTGSGKSVCVNAIITSILLNNTPRQVKFIMVDPKRVELTQYNGVPHLIAPVVVELERIVSVLKWVTREMDERYRKFSQAASRNIEDYNKHLPPSEEAMPYIVVIIDELADLMMMAPDETERVITRIAALARATGIHLVIATQRPSVDVVTGLIKANFPARIAFAVAGSVDSRVILDQPGAERLLGRGDMLYTSGDAPAPQRLQGVYVSDAEIGNITRYWRGQVSDEEMIAMSRPLGATLSASDDSRGAGSGEVIFSRGGSGSSSSSSMPWEKENATRTARQRNERSDRGDDDDANDVDDDGDDVGDEMYAQAVDMVQRLNRASVSLLQRRLRIGYTRAARLIDMMEERGVVGPAVEGSRPRDVLT